MNVMQFILTTLLLGDGGKKFILMLAAALHEVTTMHFVCFIINNIFKALFFVHIICHC